MSFTKYSFAALLTSIVLYNQYLHIAEWGELIEIMWYCNIAALVMAVGLVLKSSKISSLILTLSIITQGLWIVDFFLQMSGSGLGRTAELFTYDIHIIVVSTILHGILIPTAFVATRKWGYDKSSIWYGFIFITILLWSTYYITPIEENINCVFATCDTHEPISFIKDSYLYWIASFVIFHQLVGEFITYINRIRQN